MRAAIRQRRLAIDDQQQARAARAVCDHLQQHPAWHRAARVALYLAQDGELDPEPLVSACREHNKAVYLPVLEGQQLVFRQWRTEDELIPNRYGIGEPPATAPGLPVRELDLVLLPLVGFDRHGGRLGMGGGYYDRTLESLAEDGPLLLGLAHSLQAVEQVPREHWDISLDGVVTETGVEIINRG